MTRRGSRPPTLAAERALWTEGVRLVAGLDEAGRGAWAGPLTVAVAVLPRDRRLYGVRDSKALTEESRERLFERVVAWVVAWGVGHASAAECDRLGLSDAERLAAHRALANLGCDPDWLLLDGHWDFVGDHPSRRIVHGDATCLSIAAASILAKVTRDRIMRQEALHYPAYDFEHNKGYGCWRHRAALAGYGPCPIHRRSWSYASKLPWPTTQAGGTSSADTAAAEPSGA